MTRIPRPAIIAAASVVAVSCSVPLAGSIRAALDGGKISLAIDEAKDDAGQLDLVAVETIRRGLDSQERQTAIDVICRHPVRLGDLLLDLSLHSEDPGAAAIARSVLYRSGSLEFEPDLEKALASEDGGVRAAAVGALATTRGDRAFFETHALDPDPRVRISVLAYLVTHDSQWGQEILVEAAVSDPDPAVARAAVAGLDPDVDGSREALVASLGSEDASTRVAAAWALGSGGETVEGLLVQPATPEGLNHAAALLAGDPGHASASDYLEEAISAPDAQIRLTALVALTRAGVSVPGLESLQHDPSPRVRVAWCHLGRKLRTPEAEARREVLSAVIAEEASLEALVALAEEGGTEEARPLVWWLFETGGSSVQRYIIAFAIPTFRDSALAIRGMKSPDPAVRMEAAAAWLSRSPSSSL